MYHGGWRSRYHCYKQSAAQDSRMADFPTLLAFSVFGLQKHEMPQIKSQAIGHALMNLVTAKRILERHGIQISASFVKI